MIETTPKKRVGERLKELREGRRWSQRTFADRINVSHATISKWERGITKVDADLLPQLAGEFGVEPSFFFESIGGESRPSIADRIARELAHGWDAVGEAEREFIESQLPLLARYRQRFST